MLCTWRLSWLAVEKALCLCRGSISDTVDRFQSGEGFAGGRAQTIVSLLMSGRGRGHKPQEALWKNPFLKFSLQKKWKYESYKVSIASDF